MQITTQAMQSQGEPDPNESSYILTHTSGQGWQILRWSHQKNDWIKDHDNSENRLAIHRWAYLY